MQKAAERAARHDEHTDLRIAREALAIGVDYLCGQRPPTPYLDDLARAQDANDLATIERLRRAHRRELAEERAYIEWYDRPDIERIRNGLSFEEKAAAKRAALDESAFEDAVEARTKEILAKAKRAAYERARAQAVKELSK